MSRSQNFLEEEVALLLDELERVPALVSGEFTREIPTQKHQKAAWDALAAKLNSINLGLNRTGTQVRHKWNDMKSRTRKKASEIAKHLSGTGGGPALAEKLTAVENRLLGMIGMKSTQGVVGRCLDSNAKRANKQKYPNSETETRDGEIEANSTEVSFVILSQQDGMNTTDLEADETSFLSQENDMNYLSQENELQSERAGTSTTAETETTQSDVPWHSNNASTNKSTIRGQNFRMRKRKRIEQNVDNFEKQAIDATHELINKIEKMNNDQNENANQMRQLITTLNENIVKQNDKLDKLVELFSVMADTA